MNNRYYFPHNDFDVDYMIRSGRVDYMLFDGDFTEIQCNTNCDDWFY